MRMIVILCLLLPSICSAQQVLHPVVAPQVVNPSESGGQSIANVTYQRVTVQKVNTMNGWREGDEVDIATYLKSHPGLKGDNYVFLRDIFPQLVGARIVDTRNRNGKLQLKESPKHYIGLGQGFCGAMGVDTYAKVPVLKLPPFTGGGPQGSLELDDVPLVEVVPCVSPQPQQLPGAVRFYHPGDRQESPVGNVWKSWTKIPALPCEPTPETCDPNGTPPPKPPTEGPVGNPSGPDWPPAPNGPPVPDSTSVGHGTGGNSWDPSLTHPRVADPVY